jgi:MarR family transcriptional regulator for hemolysin
VREPTSTILKKTNTPLAEGLTDSKTSGALDGRGRTVAWMARTLHRLYDSRAQKVLATEAISISHWYYLRVLAERGKLNQLELSKRVGIASTTAVPALDNMEKRGLLERSRDTKDRRKYYVSLTESGQQLVKKLLPELTAMVTLSIDGIAPDKMNAFWEVMHQIEKNLGESSPGDALLD